MCTGPFFLKAISPNIIQHLFSSTTALRVFGSLKQNEDRSRDLGKRGKKCITSDLEDYGDGGNHKGLGLVSKEVRHVRRQKKRPSQDVQVQAEASITTRTHGLLDLHMVTLLV